MITALRMDFVLLERLVKVLMNILFFMINNLLSLLTYENIYLIANWGVIPFWLLLIFIPNHPITNFFTQSIIPPLLLAIAYAYLSYLIYMEGNILDSFELIKVSFKTLII